jgi:hypothetical protein
MSVLHMSLNIPLQEIPGYRALALIASYIFSRAVLYTVPMNTSNAKEIFQIVTFWFSKIMLTTRLAFTSVHIIS